MSNYKYAIKKLPIKSWIKYWLWRNRTGGTKYKFALSDIKEGSNFYLENTIKRKFNMFELFGKTTQDGTPTPENPIPIVNLTGNINEKIQNKNIASLETSKEKVIDGLPFTVEDGIIKINGTNNSTDNFFFDSFKAKSGTATFWVEITGYTDKDSGNASILLQKSDDNVNFSTLAEIQLKSTTVKTRQVTLNSDKFYRIRLYVDKNTFTNSEIKIQLEYGTTKTDFIPHTEQNISFPLEQGQVLAEGDYLADDGIHHVRGILDLNTLTWNEYTTAKYRSQTINNIKIPETQATIPNILAEKYRARMQNGTFANGEIGIANNGQLIVCDETGTPSGIFEYDLAEEYVEPFTEEQQIEYNKIKELYTYNEITNIDGDANLKIKYWERVER